MFEGNYPVGIRGKVVESFFIADGQCPLLIRIYKLEERVQQHIFRCSRTNIVDHSSGKEESLLLRENDECTHGYLCNQTVRLC